MSCSNSTRHVSAFIAASLMAVLSAATGMVSAQTSECVVDRYNNTICPPAKTVCLAERNGGAIKCSPPDGGVIADRYGMALCGAGRCVLDIRGEPFCAKDSGGASAKGKYGDAVCAGGCVKAQASMCSTLTR